MCSGRTLPGGQALRCTRLQGLRHQLGSACRPRSGSLPRIALRASGGGRSDILERSVAGHAILKATYRRDESFALI